jgi:transposase
LNAKTSHCIRQENIYFTTGKRSYPNRSARLAVELSRIGTIKDEAHFLHLSWDTVKDIQKHYLQRHYGNPDLNKPEYTGTDEFAVSKGHVYKTVEVNLLTGQAVYAGDGKGTEALEAFWKKLKKTDVIKAVSTDLSPAFVSSVMTGATDSTLVFDRFHAVKLKNDALDDMRRSIYRKEKDLNKRKVLAGTGWLLLCSGKDIFDDKFKSGLDNALKVNEPLMKACYLKERLKEIRIRINKEKEAKVPDLRIERADQAKIPELTAFANTLRAHKWGIPAWYGYHNLYRETRRVQQ